MSGSKANQVEEFPLSHFRELVFGRDPQAAVRYDSNLDDLVGRTHGKISCEGLEAAEFTITDLNSRNGILVNRQRIVGSARLQAGDVVQLGAGGPEFLFELEPKSPQEVRATSEAGSPRSVPATRVAPPPVPPTRAVVPTSTASASMAPHSAPAGIGKATVERMITETNRGVSRKFLGLGAGLAVLLVAAIGLFAYQTMKASEESAAREAAAPLTPSQIVENSTDSVVFVETAWDLVHTPSGDKVYHEYIRNWRSDNKPYINNGRAYIPLYIQFADGTIEPSLTTDSEGGNQPVGGNLTGSGFVVGSDGFILTNRHVAAAWNTSYLFDRGAVPGLVVRLEGEGQTSSLPGGITDKRGKRRGPGVIVGVLDQPLRRWTPAESRAFGRKPVRGQLLTGRNVYLRVTFAKTDLPYEATLERPSTQHDVAMIKINTPQSLPTVQLHDNYDQLKAGDSIVIMGYTAVSPDVVMAQKSRDPFNPRPTYRAIPVPSVTGGLVGKLIRDEQGVMRREEKEFISEFGDSIQLTANSTGAGNSGGPVFDDRGRVIGIFYAGARIPGDAEVTFAVPIRYGLALMRTSPVLK